MDAAQNVGGWVVSFAIASIMGWAILFADKQLSKVQSWSKWIFRYSIPFFGSVFAMLFVSSDLPVARDVPDAEAGTVLIISFLVAFLSFIGVAFSVVRWIDTWDKGIGRRKSQD